MKKYLVYCLASTGMLAMSTRLVCAKAVAVAKPKPLSIQIPASDSLVFDNPLYNASASSPVHSAHEKDEIKLVKRVQEAMHNLIGHFNDHKRLQALYDATHGMLAHNISFENVNLPRMPLLVDTLIEHKQIELVKQILKTQSYTLTNAECFTIIATNELPLVKLMIKSPLCKTGEQRVRLSELFHAAYNRAVEQYVLDQYQAKNFSEVMKKERAHVQKLPATVSTELFAELLKMPQVTLEDIQSFKKEIARNSKGYPHVAQEFIRLLDDRSSGR